MVTSSGSESEDELYEADLFSGIAFCQPSNLSFADHVHCFIPLDCSLSPSEGAESQASVHPSFDRTVILFNEIV